MPTNPSSHQRRQTLYPMLALAALTIAGGAALAFVVRDDPIGPAVASASASLVAGTPGGRTVAIVSPTPLPSPEPTPRPTPEPTPEPTPAVTATPEVTAAPAVTTPPPPPETTPPPATPAPTAVVVVVAGPADTVAAFYAHVSDGRFDAAYGLWSDRMRATYERIPNLDERFDETATIAFEQLYVADQSATAATVQADFVETYDGGSTQRFIGYWKLVRVDGHWLLDEPTY